MASELEKARRAAYMREWAARIKREQPERHEAMLAIRRARRAINADKIRKQEAASKRRNYAAVRASDNAYKRRNRAELMRKNKEYERANRHITRAIVMKKRAKKWHRYPAWANDEAIKFFYQCCPAGCHVDHIVPLNGRNVSGLHVENNLQWLPAAVNLAKGNSWVVH